MHLDKERVAAADHQGNQRELGWRLVFLTGVEQPRGVDVPLQVVDRHQRQAVDPGERLGHGDPDQQRSGQSRPLGDGDGLELRPIGNAGVAARLLEHRDHPAQMGARRDLGDDAAGRAVQGNLAGDDVGHDPAAVLDDGDGGLVARRLDREDAAAWRACHAITAEISGRSASRARQGGRPSTDRISGSVVMISASSPLSE